MDVTLRPSWALPLALGLCGLGLGVMAYQYGILGFSWSGRLSLLFLVLSLGPPAAAVQLGRVLLRPGRRAPAWLLALSLLAASAGLVAGSGVAFVIAPTLAHLRLRARSLPGLTLSLPSGDDRHEPSSYDRGRVVIARPGGFRAASGVSWQPGGMIDEGLAEVVSGAIAQLAHMRIDTSHDHTFAVGGDLPSRSYQLAGDDAGGWMTMFTCGRRLFITFTMGDGDTRRLHERVLASVSCRPDPTQEAAPADGVPVAVDLPSGWKRFAGDPGQLTYRVDGQVLVFLRAPGNRDPVALVAAMFQQIEQTPAHVTRLPAEGSRALWSIEGASTTAARGVVARWNCGEVPVMGLFVVEGAEATDTGTLDAGKALLLTARCK